MDDDEISLPFELTYEVIEFILTDYDFYEKIDFLNIFSHWDNKLLDILINGAEDDAHSGFFKKIIFPDKLKRYKEIKEAHKDDEKRERYYDRFYFKTIEDDIKFIEETRELIKQNLIEYKRCKTNKELVLRDFINDNGSMVEYNIRFYYALRIGAIKENKNANVIILDDFKLRDCDSIIEFINVINRIKKLIIRNSKMWSYDSEYKYSYSLWRIIINSQLTELSFVNVEIYDFTECLVDALTKSKIERFTYKNSFMNIYKRLQNINGVYLAVVHFPLIEIIKYSKIKYIEISRVKVFNGDLCKFKIDIKKAIDNCGETKVIKYDGINLHK